MCEHKHPTDLGSQTGRLWESVASLRTGSFHCAGKPRPNTQTVGRPRQTQRIWKVMRRPGEQPSSRRVKCVREPHRLVIVAVLPSRNLRACLRLWALRGSSISVGPRITSVLVLRPRAPNHCAPTAPAQRRLRYVEEVRIGAEPRGHVHGHDGCVLGSAQEGASRTPDAQMPRERRMGSKMGDRGSD